MRITITRILFAASVLLALAACGGSESSLGGAVGTDRSQISDAYDFRSAGYTVDTGCNQTLPDIFFTPHKMEFDLDNAFVLLLTTLLVEQEPATAIAQFKAWGFLDVREWNHVGFGARAYIAEHQSFVLVVFRGTTEAVEYLSNATFITLETDLAGGTATGRAHAGMWDVHRLIRDDVHGLLMQVNQANKPVIFAGHSRGGALTALQASYFKNRNAGVLETVYTFAQPRLGDRHFSEALKALIGDRYFRMEYEFDVTPRVPPSADMAAPLYDEGHIPRWLATTVETLNYDYDPGDVYILRESGYLDRDLDSYQTQLDYWRDLFGRFPNLVLSIPQLINYFPGNHHPTVYICKLASQL